MVKDNIIWVYEEWGSSSETWDFSYRLCYWDGFKMFVYHQPALTGFLKALFKRYKVVWVKRGEDVTEEMYREAKRESWGRFIGRWLGVLATVAVGYLLIMSMVTTVGK